MDKLSIFVSGTIDDMKSERKAVDDAIRSLHLDAVRAETQYSEDLSAREKCLQMARECDIYLGVYNKARYGGEIPGEGISMTEMEFNQARAGNKPMLIFVKPCPRDEENARQMAFLNRVLDLSPGKFRVSEFASLDQLQEQVAGSLMNLLVERFKFTVTRPPFLAPRDLDTFVGREAKLEELTAALSRRETALVHGLYGQGGLGKTALVLHLAHKLRGTFDGGVLWADLPIVRPAEMLARWAQAYGGDISKIEDVAARAEAVRELLRGKRVLAVLDGGVDESDDEKIAPLLRAVTDCAVIVTSRVTQLASLRTARRIDLDKMSEDEAWDLFAKHMDAERLNGKRQVIKSIGETLEFLPLALDLAAAQLGAPEHQKWTPEYLLRLLKDDRKRLPTLAYGSAGVRAAFNKSFERLSEDEQKFLAALGAFAGDDFDVTAAAFVGEVTPDAASAWLERFLRLSLVQEGRRAERYRLHPLLRDCARAVAANIDACDGRMAQYYCKLAAENGPKLEGKEIYSALAILETEIGNIYAGHAWAREQDNQAGWGLCRDYIFGAVQYFGLRAMWNDWIEWGDIGIAACQKLGDERGEGAIAGNLGIVYGKKREWDRAIEFYQKDLAISEKLGDVPGMANAYYNLGSAYYRKGDSDRAIELYQQALGTMEKLGDLHGIANAYNNLGLVYAGIEDLDRAIELYQQALVMKEKLGDLQGMARTYFNLGSVCDDIGNLDRAIESYQQALVMKEKLGDLHGMAHIYNNLGVVYRQKGEWDRAIELYQQALGTMEKLGGLYGMAMAYDNLGVVYRQKGDLDRAIESFQQAIGTMEKLGDVVLVAYTWWTLALIYEKQGKMAEAIELMEKTVADMKKNGDPDAAEHEEYVAKLKNKAQCSSPKTANRRYRGRQGK